MRSSKFSVLSISFNKFEIFNIFLTDSSFHKDIDLAHNEKIEYLNNSLSFFCFIRKKFFEEWIFSKRIKKTMVQKIHMLCSKILSILNFSKRDHKQMDSGFCFTSI